MSPEHALRRLYDGTLPCLWRQPDGAFVEEPPLRPAGILPGSFNPLHAGHEQLRTCAERRLGAPVCFELAVRNADKPSIDAPTLLGRLAQFVAQPLLLTRAATFVEKARLYPGTTFVVGVDTARRIIDPRFYGSQEHHLQAALAEIAAARCRFLVAGRRMPLLAPPESPREERPGDVVMRGMHASGNTGAFVTLADLPLPPGAEQLFEALPESEFRCDLSSTAIRLAEARGETPRQPRG